MSLTALIIGGALLLAMICVSLYGAAALPPGAQLPVHFGPGGYNRWVAKNTGLSEDKVRQLVQANTSGDGIGVPGVNVLKLNLAVHSAAPGAH